MKETLSHELEVGLPANELWPVYRNVQLAELVVKLLPDVVEKIDVVHGDGGVGTILHLHFPAGAPLGQAYKEKFTKIDDEQRVKEAQVVEGGYLDLGFRSYTVRIEIVDKDVASCLVRTIIEYELDDEFAANAAFVSTGPLVLIHQTIAKYLIEQKDTISI